MANRKIGTGFGALPKTDHGIPVWSGELWTARQRQMHSIHYAVSYRASFKPELPDFFIRRYAATPGALVLDPFGGRGTTAVQANILGRRAVHNDLNPVSLYLARARQRVPTFARAVACLDALDLQSPPGRLSESEERRLTPFFHRNTLREIVNLRNLLIEDGGRTPELMTIGLAALSRLHGHSDGFFSVYSFPQISILPEAQRRNNQRRGQKPDYRAIAPRIKKKIERDLSEPLPPVFAKAAGGNVYVCGDARELKGVKSGSIDLVVTSPPFLDKVDYLTDNWMRAWFLGLEDKTEGLELANIPDPAGWTDFMVDVVRELGRVLRTGGRAVIEVGEVRHEGRTWNLEEELAARLPLKVRGAIVRADQVLINAQQFTKLSNCWDVKNNEKGTNTNRCLVLIKE